MANGKSYSKYTVIFNEKFVPGEEHSDIHTVVIELFGTGMDDVISKAWQTVTLTPDKFEIVLVETDRGYYPRAYSRRDFRD